MQFWTNELIAVVVLGLLGFILLTFVMAWLQSSRGVKRIGKPVVSYMGNRKLTTIAETYIPGQRIVLFIITATLVVMVGAVGVLIFSFDLWNMPMYVNIMDVNVQFIFVIFAIFTSIISMAIAALYVGAKGGGFK